MNTDIFSGALRKVGIAVLVLLTLFLGALTINEIRAWDSVDPTANTITVSGLGEVFAVPDLATFSFSIIVERPTASAAQEDAAELANEAIAYLKAQGIEEKDIKTTGYNVYPRYIYPQVECFRYPCPGGERQLDGFEINQSITVKVRETTKAGTILSGLGEVGVENISGLSFTIDEPNALENEAREAAIADAKEKAEVLADQLGVRLKRVISFSESSDGGYPIPYYAEEFGRGGDVAVSSVAPDVPTGENKITSRVHITYEIR